MNRLLSAAWLVRRRNYEDVGNLVGEGFTPEEAELVISFVVENQYNQQEFAEALKKRGISDIYTVLRAESPDLFRVVE